MVVEKSWYGDRNTPEGKLRYGDSNGQYMNSHQQKENRILKGTMQTILPIIALFWLVVGISVTLAGHQGGGSHGTHEYAGAEDESGHAIPGVPFQVVVGKGKSAAEGKVENNAHMDEAIHTVVEAFTLMTKYRTQYQRYDEALTKGVLKKVVVEPRVLNRIDKEFLFLVARTKQKGKVKLLISASQLQKRGYLNQPKKLIPALAREFQWVVSKADTAPRRKMAHVTRDLKNVPIQTNKNIKYMTPVQREQTLQKLFRTYLTTEDAFQSLKGQPWFEIGSTFPQHPDHQDSTTHLYEMRVREALQLIMGNPYFETYTPKAIKSLLNGKIWNVSMVKIEQRDWATRTRVLPKDKAVTVGAKGKVIQPANILVNYHRVAQSEDPFFEVTNGLPMGALSPEQLAQVIAWEIQKNVVVKSMRGHVAQDEITAPK
jgi:hypothetical protein